MALFKVDHTQAEGGFKLLPEGEYEVFPTAADFSTSSNGNPMITVNYKIRDDVDQEGKGQELRFDRFTATERAMWRLQAASKAAQFEEGVEFDTLQEFWTAFKGRAIKVVVEHEEAEFGKNAGKIFPVVKGFKASEVGGEMSLPKVDNDPFSRNNGSIDIQDDDLPF